MKLLTCWQCAYSWPHENQPWPSNDYSALFDDGDIVSIQHPDIGMRWYKVRKTIDVHGISMTSLGTPFLTHAEAEAS